MSLPPGPLTRRLAETFPQFVLCDAALSATLGAQLDPLANPDVAAVIQWLQGNPAVAGATGDVLDPPGTPSRVAVPLDAGLVAALTPLLGATAAWIADVAAFENIAWYEQEGIVPGPQPLVPAGADWTLTTIAPRTGLEFVDIAFAGGAAPTFTLSLVNALPRHLGVYASFTRGGVAVVPEGWVSRLPDGVATGFESDTCKYLGMMLPNAAVAAIPVAGAAQSIAIALPADADAVTVRFGGVGGSFTPQTDAAGVIATVVLDMIVPWMVRCSGADPAGLARWYAGLLADQAMLASVVASGAFLLKAPDADAMFASLATGACAVMLGAPLADLRKSIATQVGAPPGKPWSWVDQLAPAAGWPAQLLAAFLHGERPQYWPATMPGTTTLDLSAATSLALALTLQPDPLSGVWPNRATTYAAEIRYAGGFSQRSTGTMPTAQSAAPIELAFGSVATRGAIALTVAMYDAGGTVVASAVAAIPASPLAGTRTIRTTVMVRDVRAAIGAATRYRLAARLTCTGGSYVWDATADPSTGVAPASPLTALVALSLQQDALCLGYAWSARDQNVTVCGGTAPLQNAFFIRNIGTAVPASQDRTIDCGLVRAAVPTYAADGSPGLYLDARLPDALLRPVAFGTGAFDQQSTRAVARFAGAPIAICQVGGEYAAAVGPGDLMQIVRLADAPVDDAVAPVACVFGGGGSRIGLLSQPVAIAATPGGMLLVLEQGNARLQAFDVNGNPTALFGGQPGVALDPDARYTALAVSPDALIYLAGRGADGGCFLDVHLADGTLLCRTPGVHAAAIAVDAQGTVFTLDYDMLIGPSGRAEPMLSRWTPHG